MRLIPQATTSVTLGSSKRLEIFALASSYWTLLIEGSVATAFVLGCMRWLSRFRDWLLMLFIVTTYFYAPAAGICLYLIIMGLAQCSSKQVSTRIAHLYLFGLLQLARLGNGADLLIRLQDYVAIRGSVQSE